MQHKIIERSAYIDHLEKVERAALDVLAAADLSLKGNDSKMPESIEVMREALGLHVDVREEAKSLHEKITQSLHHGTDGEAIAGFRRDIEHLKNRMAIQERLLKVQPRPNLKDRVENVEEDIARLRRDIPRMVGEGIKNQQRVMAKFTGWEEKPKKPEKTSETP